MFRIKDIAAHEGKTVTVRGWLYSHTGKGKLRFLKVRDGTGIVQCVVFRKDVTPDVFQAVGRLTQESSLVVVGEVRADDRSPGGYEIAVSDLKVIQIAEEYPIQPKNHGVHFLASHRHLWVRSAQQQSILRVRAEVIRAAREWLDTNGFLNLDVPIITPLSVEGTTTLFEIDYFGDRAYLSQSGQLYNEALAMAFGRVYSCGPVFRAEGSKTRRHLTEFWMIEPEIAFCELDELIEIEEQLISHVVGEVLTKRLDDLSTLGHDFSHLEQVAPPFPRITYDEALGMLHKIRDSTTDPQHRQLLSIEWGADFGAPHDAAISSQFEKPVFVSHFPIAAKAFYMKPVSSRAQVSLSVDLLAPDGYGEITGGGQRIADPELLEMHLRFSGLDPTQYAWYVDLRRYGTVMHCGFGLGVERMVAWICGRSHVREAIPFPRLYKSIPM